MTQNVRINWTLAIAVPSAMAAMTTIYAFMVSKEFRCSITHLIDVKSEFCENNNTNQSMVRLNILTVTGEPIPNAGVEFIGNDNPQQEFSDQNGYVQAEVKNLGSVRVIVKANNYQDTAITIDTSIQQPTIKQIRLVPTPKSTSQSSPEPTNPSQNISQCIGLRYLYLSDFPVFNDQPPYDVGVVLYTFPGYPANLAGLQRGDLIVSVNGQSLKATGDIEKIIAKLKVGDLGQIRAFHFAYTTISKTAVYVSGTYQDKIFKVSVRDCY
jgi:hypothetical protein